MPKSGTYGSVRGVPGNRHPYRDRQHPGARSAFDRVKNLANRRNNSLYFDSLRELEWRRRESNPRPQIFCRRFYMLSRVFNLAGCYPTGREDRQRFRYFFNASAPDELPSRSCEI